jgi:hypothetical protein
MSVRPGGVEARSRGILRARKRRSPDNAGVDDEKRVEQVLDAVHSRRSNRIAINKERGICGVAERNAQTFRDLKCGGGWNDR